ncbi:MAG: hypothetical protein IPQ07_08230 [Myxococcales bacterium]|nr:hypothetical protein [Myxococcales bacterium]
MKLALAATLVLAVSACSDGGTSPPDAPEGTPDAAPRQVVMGPKTLLVGELAESIFTGGAQDMAMITLTAPVAKLDWNIHGHAGGSTQTVKEELGVMSATYAFTPTAQAEWFLLLRNKDTAPMTVEVKIELYGAITWSGWQ